MEKAFDVIGVDHLIADLCVSIDHLPETDGVSTMNDYLWQCGGNVPSAIIALARLGAKCSMLGSVGNDVLGELNLSDMKRHGVDLSHMYQQDGPTTLALCLAEAETEGRSFIVRRGVDEPLTEEQVDESFIASAKYLHIGTGEKHARDIAVRFARRNGVIVSMDAGYYYEDAEKIIPDIDLFVMSNIFYNGYYGEGHDSDIGEILGRCEELLALGPEVVIITLGARGCAGVDNKGARFVLPPFSGHTIVDTTGAGDVYHGAFVYAHMQGWDTEYCAKFSSAVSYINCTSLGGRVGIPNREMVDRFLADNTIDYSDIEPRREFYRNIMRFDSGMFK